MCAATVHPPIHGCAALHGPHPGHAVPMTDTVILTTDRATGPPVAGESSRRAELDWLRLGAVLLVFLAHVGQIFSPNEAWHIESPDRSRTVGLFTVALGPWLMPLFMLVAGASSWFAIRRYGTGRFFRGRVLRLLVPLVAGTFLVVPPQMYYRALARGTFEGSFVAFYPRFFDGVYPEGNFSYGHLWFLVYLFLLMTASLPVLAYLTGPGGRILLARVADRCEEGLGILWLFVPMAITQLVLRVPFTMTTGAVFNDWATHAWFLLAFLYGFAIMGEPRLGDAVDRQWRRVAVPAIASTTLLLVWAWPGDVYARIPGEPSASYVGWWLNFTLASWAWLVLVLGAARRYLGSSVPGLRRWTDAAYPIYILHQPIIVVVAFHIVAWPMPVPVRFAAIALAALALTLTAIEALRRIPPLRIIVGLPPNASRPDHDAAAA
jgi:glucans biosynthesis protein C